jgi:beta-phosphoglucomutase
VAKEALQNRIPAAIVFDFDGVLVDSEAAHGEALGAAGAALGLSSPVDRPGWYIGLGDAECFRQMAVFSGRKLTPLDLDLLMTRKALHFGRQCRAGRIAAFPGSIALVHAAAEVAPIAVCSGSRRTEILPILEMLGLADLLSALVTADDVARTKPDPMPYLLTAARLSISPSACIAIEDSPAGIAAALAAGYRRIHAVCHTFEPARLAQAHQIHHSTEGMSVAELVDSTAG